MHLVHHRRHALHASLAFGLAALLAACSGEGSNPQTTIVEAAPLAPPSGFAAAPPRVARKTAHRRTIIVQAGQSLHGVAASHHVSERAIVAANGLNPPYELRSGMRLVIPEAGGKSHGKEPPAARPVKLAHATAAPARTADKPKRRASTAEVIPLD